MSRERFYGTEIESATAYQRYTVQARCMMTDMLNLVPRTGEAQVFFEEVMWLLERWGYITTCDHCVSWRVVDDQFACAGCGDVPFVVEENDEEDDE